jgi:hypothetical protein
MHVQIHDKINRIYAGTPRYPSTHTSQGLWPSKSRVYTHAVHIVYRTHSCSNQNSTCTRTGANLSTSGSFTILTIHIHAFTRHVGSHTKVARSITVFAHICVKYSSFHESSYRFQRGYPCAEFRCHRAARCIYASMRVCVITRYTVEYSTYVLCLLCT